MVLLLVQRVPLLNSSSLGQVLVPTLVVYNEIDPAIASVLHVLLPELELPLANCTSTQHTDDDRRDLAKELCEGAELVGVAQFRSAKSSLQSLKGSLLGRYCE